MPHLHLSLQAGDNMILKRMKRRHLREDSIAFCEEIRRARPGIVFGADLIAGFPTETDEMFENSVRLVEECGLTYLHVFPFSARPGTPAAKMPQLDGPTVRARAKRLRDCGAEAVKLHLDAGVGSNGPVLMETDTIGRTEQFATVRLSEPQDVGAIVTAELTGHDGHEFEGRRAA